MDTHDCIDIKFNTFLCQTGNAGPLVNKLALVDRITSMEQFSISLEIELQPSNGNKESETYKSFPEEATTQFFPNSKAQSSVFGMISSLAKMPLNLETRKNSFKRD